MKSLSKTFLGIVLLSSGSLCPACGSSNNKNYSESTDSIQSDSISQNNKVVEENQYDVTEITSELVEALNNYCTASYFSEGLAAVKKDGKWGFINIKGEEVIPCLYEDTSDFSEGLAVVKKDGNRVLLNPEGEEILLSGYELHDFLGFYEGLARVEKMASGDILISREKK